MRQEFDDEYLALCDLYQEVERRYGPGEPLLQILAGWMQMIISPPPKPTLAFDVRPKWFQSDEVIETLRRFMKGDYTADQIDELCKFVRKLNSDTRSITSVRQQTAPPRSRQSTAERIRKAARELGKLCKDLGNFENYRRALCKQAGVDDNARGWQEDTVREALRGTEYDPRIR